MSAIAFWLNGLTSLQEKGMFVSKSTILHVIDTTGPGGAETVYIQLANACKEHGYRSVALVRGPGWVENQLKSHGIEYYVLDCKGSFNVRYLCQLVRLIKKLKVKTIQSHLLGSNVYTSMAGILTKTPVITTFHGHVDISPNERFRALKFAAISKGSKKIVAVTKELYKAILSEANVEFANKACVIPNGIDTQQLTALPLSFPNKSADTAVYTFGCLGNVRKAKNYFLAIDFISLLTTQGQRCRLVIAGDDSKPLAAELKQYVETKGLREHVTFLGFVSDVPDFFQSIDIFLMTSSSEGHPLALTQALAAGKPILTTPNGVEEIVTDQETAFISCDHTADALLRSFKVISGDSKLVRNVVHKARQLAIDEFEKGTMCEKYIQQYG